MAVGRGGEWAWENPRGMEFLTSPGLSQTNLSHGTFCKQWFLQLKKKKEEQAAMCNSNGAVSSSCFVVKVCHTAVSSDQAFVIF